MEEKRESNLKKTVWSEYAHRFLVQLEESEFACAAAVKARKSMELEIEDLHIQMDDITKAKMSVSRTAIFTHTQSR